VLVLLTVGLTCSGPIPPSPEECSFLLFVKPAKELLKPRIGLDSLNGVKRVAQLIVAPSFVDEVFTGMACRGDVPSAFGAGNYVMPSRGHLPVTEGTAFGHTAGNAILGKHINSVSIRKHL
jgi:hypothetical protein